MTKTLHTLLCCLFLAGCASQGTAPNGDQPGSAQGEQKFMDKLSALGSAVSTGVGDLFSTKFRKLDGMIKAGQDEEAYKYYSANQASFSKLTPVQLEVVNGLLSRSLYREFKNLADAGQDSQAIRVVESKPTLAAMFGPDQRASVQDVRLRIKEQDFSRLARSGDDTAALNYLERDRSFYAHLQGETKKLAQDLLDRVGRASEVEIDAAGTALSALGKSDLAQANGWRALGDARKSAQAVIARDQSRPLLAATLQPKLDALRTGLVTSEAALRGAAPRAFASYDVLGADNFRADYPIPVSDAELAAAYTAIRPRLAGASADAIARYKRFYGGGLDTEQRRDLGQLYMAKLLQQSGKKGPVAMLLLSESARSAGFEADTLESGTVIVQTNLLQSEELPVSIATGKLAVPVVESRGRSAAAVLASDSARDKALIVFVKFSEAVLRNRMVNKTSVRSQYLSGTRRVPNPAYAEARKKVQSAMETVKVYQNMPRTTGNDSLSALATLTGSVGSSLAQDELAAAERELQDTPQTIEQEVFSPYAYATEDHKVEKSLKVSYVAMEVSSKRTLEGHWDVKDERGFKLATGVHRKDKDVDRILTAHQTEADMEGYMAQGLELTYEQIWSRVGAELRGRW
jgi:hypothetical protein